MKIKKLIYSILFFTFFSCQENPDSRKEPLAQENKTIDSSHHQQKSLSLIDSTKIVMDTASNLIWMKDDFSYIKGRFLNDWNEVFEWEKEMNTSKYAGYNDWRVPTIKEYRTINKNNADREKYNKAFNYIDSACVWGKGPYAFWSSTTPNKNTASYISFLDGFATSGSRAKHYANPYSDWEGVELGMSVRLVRDNK